MGSIDMVTEEHEGAREGEGERERRFCKRLVERTVVLGHECRHG